MQEVRRKKGETGNQVTLIGQKRYNHGASVDTYSGLEIVY